MGNCLRKEKTYGGEYKIKDTEMLREEGFELAETELNTSNISDSDCTRVIHEEDDSALVHNKHAYLNADNHETLSGSSKHMHDMRETIIDKEGIENVPDIEGDNKSASTTVEILENIEDEESEEAEVVLTVLGSVGVDKDSSHDSHEKITMHRQVSPPSLHQPLAACHPTVTEL